MARLLLPAMVQPSLLFRPVRTSTINSCLSATSSDRTRARILIKLDERDGQTIGIVLSRIFSAF
jgi:hypothetical protein